MIKMDRERERESRGKLMELREREREREIEMVIPDYLCSHKTNSLSQIEYDSTNMQFK